MGCFGYSECRLGQPDFSLILRPIDKQRRRTGNTASDATEFLTQPLTQETLDPFVTL
ncbi:hypothetical protein CCP2SC5_140030 [Azospirillaceae bacterium]